MDTTKYYITKPYIYTEEETLDVSNIPLLTRRRMSQLEKISMQCFNKTFVPNTQYKTVFSSNWGEWQVTEGLISKYYTDKEFHPSRFSISVHNAFCGMLSILTKNQSPYTAIASGKDSIETGLIEAFLYQSDTLFIYADESTPKLYQDYIGLQKSQALSLFISKDKLESSSTPIKLDFITCKNSMSFEAVSNFLSHRSDVLQGKYIRIEYI
jgi:hypothetical protein